MRSAIDIELRERKIAEEQDGKPPFLYYYTDMQAAYNMIRNKEFWWGNTATMNDEQELLFFISELRGALLNSIPETKKSELDTLIQKMNNRIDSVYPFAMCFSHRKDDAAQWERYANNATGISIEFNRAKLRSLFNYNFVLPGKVEYKYDIKKHDHFDLLKHYFTTGELICFSSIDGVIDNILACSVLYKHKSFSAEDEYRFSTLPFYETGITKIPHSRIEYECRNGVIKLFLKIKIDKLSEEEGLHYEDLFESITIGPRSHQRLNDMKSFCRENGFPKLANNIYYSECPLQ